MCAAVYTTSRPVSTSFSALCVQSWLAIQIGNPAVSDGSSEVGAAMCHDWLASDAQLQLCFPLDTDQGPHIRSALPMCSSAVSYSTCSDVCRSSGRQDTGNTSKDSKVIDVAVRGKHCTNAVPCSIVSRCLQPSTLVPETSFCLLSRAQQHTAQATLHLSRCKAHGMGDGSTANDRLFRHAAVNTVYHTAQRTHKRLC